MQLVNKIEISIDAEFDVENVKRIGIYKEGQKRPILVALTNWNKMEILKNANKPKGTEYWISNVLTHREQVQKKTLLKHMRNARQKGYKARLWRNKLIIN